MWVIGSGRDTVTRFASDSPKWEEGFHYEIYKCQACQHVVLFRWDVDTRYWDRTPNAEVLYPNAREAPIGLPERARKAYDSAERVRKVDANSYAVQLRRMLEFICIDQQASGNTLAKKLEDLAKQDLIPDKLSEIAKYLKNFGNVGAHADDFDVTEEEIPILDALARAVAEYVYTAPDLARQAEERFKKLKEGKQ